MYKDKIIQKEKITRRIKEICRALKDIEKNEKYNLAVFALMGATYGASLLNSGEWYYPIMGAISGSMVGRRLLYG